MRKLFSLILLFTFLHGQVGYPMALHYCSEADMYYVFLGGDETNSCGEEEKQMLPESTKKSCCTEDITSTCDKPLEINSSGQVSDEECCTDEDFRLCLTEAGKEPRSLDAFQCTFIFLPAFSIPFSTIVSCGTWAETFTPPPLISDSPQALLSVFRI